MPHHPSSSSSSSLACPIGFNAQHSPMGAYTSFTCGHANTAGGIGLELGKPAGQDIYVGVKEGPRTSGETLVCLPFFRGARASRAADYQVEGAGTASAGRGVRAYDEGEVTRQYGWATDAWTTPDFVFSLYTPFGPIPDPAIANHDALRDAVLPAITGTLRVDNSKGKGVKTAVFAIDFGEAGSRVLPSGENGEAGTVGFAWKRSMGVLARVEEGGKATVIPIQRFSVADALSDANPVHALGNTAGVAIEVPAGEVCTVTLVIGGYLGGVVTTGLDATYLYARYYAGLQDVLSCGMSRAGELRAAARKLDQRLANSGLSEAQQFLIAHSTRSYYGNTQLLDVGGEPFWVVNEGEYCMMNTLDLSVDQMFWELEQNPWVVRNLLDGFARRYSYVDKLRTRSGRLIEGGISFTHDMGVNNNFSPPEYSSYELPNLAVCFSYMTAEQLCNWVLMAATYANATGDLEWARRNRHLVEACGNSLLNRCGDTGVIQHDSSRCNGGAEITTYDSLDHSLAQTRNNLYIAVKCWASFLAIRSLMRSAGEREEGPWLANARAAAGTVVSQAGSDGVVPAVFERDNPGFASRILPAAEALIYPMMWARSGGDDELAEFGPLVQVLRQHVGTLLRDPAGRNLFTDGGLRLSSTSNNSWMSKIAIFQHVARHVLHLEEDPGLAEMFARADVAHVGWQAIGSAYHACCDQIVSGEAKGSRYYPRIITTALWLDRASRAERAVGAGEAVGQA